ncbi:MAG: hypothetical protein GY757_20295 [bacterium]|nr:hypothetical protein [bacterium]
MKKEESKKWRCVLRTISKAPAKRIKESRANNRHLIFFAGGVTKKPKAAAFLFAFYFLLFSPVSGFENSLILDISALFKEKAQSCTNTIRTLSGFETCSKRFCSKPEQECSSQMIR